MKYSDRFNKDFYWYLSVRHIFNFDGQHTYINKKGQSLITFDSNGVSGKEAFYLYDSQGVIKPTKHPNLLFTLLKTKGSVNLHIKMYAEDLAKSYLSKLEFREYCEEFKAPVWFREAVEKQRWNYV